VNKRYAEQGNCNYLEICRESNTMKYIIQLMYQIYISICLYDITVQYILPISSLSKKLVFKDVKKVLPIRGNGNLYDMFIKYVQVVLI
jgi:hypothetical protein